MFIAVNIKIGNLIGSRRIGVQKGPGAVSTAHRCLLFDFSGCSCSLSSMSFKGICRLADNVPNGVRELRRRVSRRLQSSFGRLVLVPLRVAGGAMNIHDYDRVLNRTRHVPHMCLNMCRHVPSRCEAETCRRGPFALKELNGNTYVLTRITQCTRCVTNSINPHKLTFSNRTARMHIVRLWYRSVAHLTRHRCVVGPRLPCQSLLDQAPYPARRRAILSSRS